MKTLKFALSISLFFTAISTVSAQSNVTGWLASFNTFKTGKKTSIHAEAQFRSTDEVQQLQTLLLRSGLNYRLSKAVTVTAGYGFIRNKRVINNAAGYAPEHRIWQQLLINHKLGTTTLAHRFRLEQRFLGHVVVRNGEMETAGNKYANRFRYFFRNMLPFSPDGFTRKGPFAALQNEVFLNFASKSSTNGETFDQNRLYLALGYRLHTSFDIEAGYMNQYINGTGNAFTNNHVIQLAGYLRL